jgi:O-antigen/teichoic acid export membrane protein
MAKLRADGKALYFAGVNLISILTNIGLNVFFVYFCMGWAEEGVSNFFTEHFYNPSIGIGYVFIANLAASAVKFILLLPLLVKNLFKFHFFTWKIMIWYAFPLLIAGLAGIANETIDRILLKNILSPVVGLNEALRQVGIYGAVYKISIIITLFIQAFRYAAEPFFFHQEKNKNAPFTYAVVMNFFVIICVTVFMGVILYIDVVKHFLRQKEYWEGLHVVPVLLMANVFLGIYYNLSAWYKLSGKTRFGAYFSIFGALITLTLNFLWIPRYGYTGAAWATLCCYFSMAVISYIFSRKHYKIPYETGKIALYIISAWLVVYLSSQFHVENIWLKYSIYALILSTYIFVALKIEKKNYLTLKKTSIK